MDSRFILFVPVVAVALVAAGCGDDEAVRPAQNALYTDPADYWGVYKGTRIDLEDPAMAPSTAQLIGESYLTLDTEDVTFTMTHERIDFGGTSQFRVFMNDEGEKYRAMELIVYRVGNVSRTQIGRIDIARNKAAGREPSTPEQLDKYIQIFDGIKWYFEVLPDGFRQLDMDGSPGLYEFKRDRSESAAAAAASNSIDQTGTDGADGSGDDPPGQGIANVGGA